jgi:hypothetical protein
MRRNTARTREPLGELDPVKARKHHDEQRKIYMLLFGDELGFLAIGRCQHLKAFLAQVCLQHFDYLRIIIDDQDRSEHAHLQGRATRPYHPTRS